MLIIILLSVIAIWLEIKWLDERKTSKEYHRFHTNTNIPTILTSSKTIKNKKTSGSKSLLGLVPNTIAIQLNIPPNRMIRNVVKVLLIIINRIISKAKQWNNQMQTKPYFDFSLVFGSA